MFVKKLVDMATKKPASSLSSLRADDVDPRLVFHYGIPAGSSTLAYDPIQKILAISTKDGRIKLFGRDNTQTLLESSESVSSKILQFLDNRGILLNVNVLNHIEVWDIENKQLAHIYDYKDEITSFMVMQRCSFVYVGNASGNVSVLRLDQEPLHLVNMQYHIPSSASHVSTTEDTKDSAIISILLQPLGESRRVLLIFRDGLIVLWGIQESKVLFSTGGNSTLSLGQEPRKVTSACWACQSGSKVVVGYNSGEIFIWSIPLSSVKDEEDVYTSQNIPISKLNLGYKMDKIPIILLRWVYGDGRSSRLYVNGTSKDGYSNLFQIVLLQESTESRTIKLVIPLPEHCADMRIVSSGEIKQQTQDFLLLLLESGNLCAFDDSDIEKYLLQSQQSKAPSNPSHVMVKIPFIHSSITVAKYFTDNSLQSTNMDETHPPGKAFPSLVPIYTKEKIGGSSIRIEGFTKIRNVYITGHIDGSINVWDISSPFLVLLLSIRDQDEHSLSGVPVTALYFDISSRILISGDQHGMVRIFTFKPEQASTKQGCSSNIHDIKHIKVIGVVTSIHMNSIAGNLVIGSDEGSVSIIDVKGPTILSQRHFSSELYTGAIQFEHCSSSGSQQSILLVALKDSSVLALDGDTGNPLSTCGVRCKKPAKALFMALLDKLDTSGHGYHVSSPRANQGQMGKETISKQSLVLVCSEKAVHLYSLTYLVQGIKKVHNKKKFQGTCWWASTFSSPSGIGLILLFTSGKIEARSIPDLSLLKETSLRGLTVPYSKSSPTSDLSFCCSSEGELILVNKEQEIFFISILYRKDIYRNLESLKLIYKDSIPVHNEATSTTPSSKEKKKGLFGSVIKDMKGNKTKHCLDTEVQDSEASIAELPVIFSTANFPLGAGRIEELNVDKNDPELNIDDIDLDDVCEKPKGRSMSSINKQKLSGKFQAFKGKLNAGKLKHKETSVEEQRDEKNIDALDEIKKKYGYSSSSESTTMRVAESKLAENLRKLQSIGTRTAAMQNTAQSFSAAAKDLLQTLQREKKGS
ncbi:hypothetical protein H6P81_018811 [Aristolochia fimbriata]|uniref:Lethal giant larvae (Lgl)-like C-terminal domain-containing protein n=1 Tax=Aristolochia fimbriata TaxID=158543 RepID=A0AAV7E2B4_ARIFI|nr:hypothetical protein H6P81_018811 [Aristolochia fimbriata]